MGLEEVKNDNEKKKSEGNEGDKNEGKSEGDEGVNNGSEGESKQTSEDKEDTDNNGKIEEDKEIDNGMEGENLGENNQNKSNGIKPDEGSNKDDVTGENNKGNEGDNGVKK